MAAGRHHLAVILLSVALALSSLNLSACFVFKGSVTCLDCTHNHPPHLSGVKVSVKCAGEKKLAMATTEEDGSFETSVVVPSSKSSPAASVLSCSAKILGAIRQLYVPMKASESKIVVVKGAGESDDNNHYYMTTSEPLRFYTKCPNAAKCSVGIIGGSKTVDLPLPREWGLPPTSYYIMPFIPIIGIP